MCHFHPPKKPAAKEHKQCLMQMAFVEDEQQTSDVTQTVDVIVTLMTGHAL